MKLIKKYAGFLLMLTYVIVLLLYSRGTGL